MHIRAKKQTRELISSPWRHMNTQQRWPKSPAVTSLSPGMRVNAWYINSISGTSSRYIIKVTSKHTLTIHPQCASLLKVHLQDTSSNTPILKVHPSSRYTLRYILKVTTGNFCVSKHTHTHTNTLLIIICKVKSTNTKIKHSHSNNTFQLSKSSILPLFKSKKTHTETITSYKAW